MRWHEILHEQAILRLGDDDLKVATNPSTALVRSWLASSTEGTLRALIHKQTGDLFIWNGYDATHYDVANLLAASGHANSRLDDYIEIWIPEVGRVAAHENALVAIDQRSGNPIRHDDSEWGWADPELLRGIRDNPHLTRLNGGSEPAIEVW